MKENDSIKIVLDARFLNSNTDQQSKSWPLKPLATELARANKKYKSASDLMYTYAHAALDLETFELTGVSSGDKILLSLEDFLASKVFQIFLNSKCFCFFEICFVKNLHWFISMIFFSCETLNHIYCNLSDNLMILSIKKLEISSWKLFPHACYCNLSWSRYWF